MTFFEHTMPELVNQLRRIADALEQDPLQFGLPSDGSHTAGNTVPVCNCHPAMMRAHPQGKIKGCTFYVRSDQP